MQKKNSGSKQSRDIWANMEYLAYDEVKGHGNKVNNNKRKKQEFDKRVGQLLKQQLIK